MRILGIVHQPDAGPGVFGEAVSAAGHRLELWQPALGESAPVELDQYRGVLTFGGGMHPDQEDAHPWLAEEKRLLAQALEQEIPLLAVCLGAELLAEAAGTRAGRAAIPEIGWYPVQVTEEGRRDPLFASLPSRFEALEWHSYGFPPPPDAVALAWSPASLQAYRANEWAWGIQFHAEVTLQTFESWLDRYRDDPDAVKLGIDPAVLRVQTRSAIRRWNRMGRGLCARFLQVADRAKAGVQQRSPG